MIRVHRFHYVLEIDPATKVVLFVAPCDFTPKRVKAPKRKPLSDGAVETSEIKRAKVGADAETPPTQNESHAPLENHETKCFTESAEAETQDATGGIGVQPSTVRLLFGEETVSQMLRVRSL